MKKTIGYGFKLASESLEKAMKVYTSGDGYSDTLNEAKEDYERAVDRGDLPANSKATFFKVVVETI